MSITVLHGGALETLRTLPSGSVQCAVTSPPYFGLRDYGVEGQIGLEESPDAYVATLVDVFAEMRRVLRDDGTFWLNLGDSYNNFRVQMGPGQAIHGRDKLNGKPAPDSGRRRGWAPLKEKDRMMIPARVALALQADGWWLRDEIVWHKPRTTPFPANDRTVSAHEMVYLFAKRERYFFDWAAIEEPAAYAGQTRQYGKVFRRLNEAGSSAARNYDEDRIFTVRETRRARSVWSISPSPYKDAHFATMPVTLAEQCVKAGSAPGDVVLDPFGGAGTTALAARNLGRSAILIELKPSYCVLAKRRLGLPLYLWDHLIMASDARIEMTKVLRA